MRNGQRRIVLIVQPAFCILHSCCGRLPRSTAPTSCSATTTRVPSARDADGREVGAVRGVLASVLGMINGGATHVGVATDHVIESFRNRLWPGYKTGDGIDPDLLRAVSAARGGADRARRRRLADGRVRGRRRAGGGRGDGGARPARRARGHLHAGQGPGAVRARHARRADGSRATRTIRDEAGVIAKFGVRAGVDSRLPGAGRRCRRRLSRACRAGARSRRRRCSRSSAISKRFPPTGARGA